MRTIPPYSTLQHWKWPTWTAIYQLTVTWLLWKRQQPETKRWTLEWLILESLRMRLLQGRSYLGLVWILLVLNTVATCPDPDNRDLNTFSFPILPIQVPRIQIIEIWILLALPILPIQGSSYADNRDLNTYSFTDSELFSSTPQVQRNKVWLVSVTHSMVYTSWLLGLGSS